MPRLSIFEGNIKMSWLAFSLHLSRYHILCDGRHLTSLLVHFVETAEFPLNENTYRRLSVILVLNFKKTL